MYIFCYNKWVCLSSTLRHFFFFKWFSIYSCFFFIVQFFNIKYEFWLNIDLFIFRFKTYQTIIFKTYLISKLFILNLYRFIYDQRIFIIYYLILFKNFKSNNTCDLLISICSNYSCSLYFINMLHCKKDSEFSFSFIGSHSSWNLFNVFFNYIWF